MQSSSMDRTLTTKSVRFREWSQWTAATTLVAAGTLALISATTIDKLSERGDVTVDLSAFRKLGSTSLALDRIDDEKLIAEEARLIDRAAFAASESLPKTRTAFTKIRLHPAKRKTMVVQKNTLSPVNIAVSTPPVSRILSGTPIVLSKADAEEIAALERAPDPAVESRALAQVYRNLRFRFVAAVERVETKDFPAESIAIAENTPSFEYDEVPELDESAFALPKAIAETKTDFENGAVETAPAKTELAAAALPPPSPNGTDSISVSASIANQVSEKRDLDETPTADAETLRSAREIQTASPSTPAVATISSPGLDLIPDAAPTAAKPPRVVKTTHEAEVKQATGPPETPKSSPITAPSSLQAKSPSGLDPKAEISPPSSSPTANTSPSDSTDHSTDLREYSKDVAAVYEPNPRESTDYSNGTAEDSIIDGDFSARPSAATQPVATTKDYGHGIHGDGKGITIDWNEDASTGAGFPTGGKVSTTSLGGKVYVGRPGEAAAPTTVASATRSNDADVQKSLAKFSFASPKKKVAALTTAIRTTASSALVAEPAVDTRKCETSRTGVEAFNASAEKDSLSICRRELSLEGPSDGAQSRWWESYENETEHWPTLSFAKPGDATSTNRTPLLSTASIRILSAVAKTNTHTGTGIVFGEVAKDLEIQLLGRSDSPIYLDAGMKPHDPAADGVGSRQFVFLNVEPGQPLLIVKSRDKNLSGAIPLVVKSGMATHLAVTEPREVDLEFTVFDASAAKETRLANLTAEVIGQPGKMGITDRTGSLKIRRVAAFDEFPIYVDVLKNEKSYKNRFRIRPSTIARGAFPLFFFDETRVAGWLAQLAGGLSPYSGLIAGVAPASALGKSKIDARFLKIGILEKKSSLVPERYLLDEHDRLVSDSALGAGRTRYIGVQIPEGPTIPTIVDAKGAVRWSELVYAQPGVINVVSPDL